MSCRIMMFFPITFLLLLISPSFVLSLKCYNSKEGFVLNYTMTSDTVPPFSSQCELVDALACYVWIRWNPLTNTTLLDIRAFSSFDGSTASQDTLTITVLMHRNADETSLSLAHNLNYYCDSTDACNNEDHVKRLLRSLVIHEEFQKELTPLIQIVSPFDPEATACLDFSNTTAACPSSDLKTCQRCEIVVNKPSTSIEHVCARCPQNSEPENMIARLKVFHLSDPTQNFDNAILACQLKTCNTVANIDRIYQTSQITFDSNTFSKK